MNYTGTGIHALDIFTAAGVRVPAAYDTVNGWGVNIPSIATYYVPLGSLFGGLVCETQDQSLSMKWNAALAGTATFEVTNFPATLGDLSNGGPDVTDWDTSAGWQLFNPATNSSLAYTAVTGAGNSWTNLTLTMGGTTVGGSFQNMPGTTMRRIRMKLIVTTVGFLRAVPWGKIGS